MLLLTLALFAVLFSAGDTRDAFPELTSFHVIQISSFFNSTWVQNRGSGWLGDMQIHGWDSDSGSIILLKPWSKGNFSNDEILEMEELFRVYFLGFVREIQERSSDFQMEYPFEIQGIAGCELQSGGAFQSFLMAGLGGLDFLSFKNYSCWPAPEGGTRAQKICALISQYKGICDTVENLLIKTCPRYLMGVLDAGKADLQKQVKPEAWLSQGPNPRPGHLQLVCHVSGFHPKPVWVMWMRGEQEQPETQRGDVLPNADDTWYLQVTLDVAAEEAAGLSCRVKHSSLGGQDIVLHWGHSISIGWIILAVILPSLIILLFFVLWFYRRWSYEDIL
ncbi:PREDICTED: T-cell surface glycoprotein CD1b2-like isoform X1 [Chinchilla lanigera]|uniref:T-cell surface glycoprotein CD1b2-like isoform X1 n=1 Tax=Chinchilla lanigera TaxID=34839 RepID=UPI00038EB966|nr:PREDICTED: T-cell surface glycoprotein CD1b2-like isoform X1 [Chinchilla lanigera]